MLILVRLVHCADLMMDRASLLPFHHSFGIGVTRWYFLRHDRELQSQGDAEYVLKNLREVKPDGLLQ